ncbi:hypothetical protein CANINC_002095 [Pichia inconspicua]|uniref:Mo25-like protein n=1 Tax=Pichia inconspicua TaxID=52247 RepID=A0A4T0X200_9ASCO|nr:hypothetical protein CANINC_002095 [[Candida] inconspicua]
MAFLFKRSTKTTSDTVKQLNEQILKLETSYGSEKKKAQDDITRHLVTIKMFINGDAHTFTDSAQSFHESTTHLCQEVINADLIYNLIVHLVDIEFDSRKIVMTLFNFLLGQRVSNKLITVEYLLKNPKVIYALMQGPQSMEVSLNMGIMLRDALKYEQLASMIMSTQSFWPYFRFVDSECFEIATDAFATLNDLFREHPNVVSTFFSSDSNTQKFIDNINSLILNGNYVTKRESTKLLADLMMVKLNYNMMTRYVNDVENLKVIMLLLGDKSKNIQIEGFNVFKIFVANPKKEKAIVDILVKNREKLLEFLFSLNKERGDDLFIAEKDYIIQQVESLPKIVSTEKNLDGKDPFLSAL